MMAAELEDGGVEAELLEEYIDRVGSGTRRMTALIEDLLGRATQDAALQLRRVDVATLAEEVAADHGASDQVKVGDIPEVRADAALVRQVLDNLLGNALKFVAPGDEPRITVTGRRTDWAPSRSPSPTRASGCRPGPTSASSRSTTVPTRRTTDAGWGWPSAAGSSSGTVAPSPRATTQRAGVRSSS